MGRVNIPVIFVLFGMFFIDRHVNAIVNYCAQNTYTTNSSWLQLNKEASSYEYALEQQFKGLHCCAKGYRSIEWYKDGKAYPWPSGTSNLILYPESANQTIYTQTVSATDTGNYTCLLRNDTHYRTHTIHLHVFDKIPDAPKITYKPKPRQEVEIGQTVRLFCEAFVGRVDLPDAHSDAAWRREGENGTVEDQPGIHQEKVSREDGLTIGVYLVIDKVSEEDFGSYICSISKPDKIINMNVILDEKVMIDLIDPNPVPWKKIIIVSAIILILIATIVVLNMQYGLAVRVLFKDKFGIIEEGDGKITDALICYSSNDAEYALQFVLPKLESKYHYKCSSKEFSCNFNYWHVEMAEAARKTRRIIAIVSPGAFNDNWDATTLYQALKQLLALDPAHHHPITCITLKELPCSVPQIKNAQGETLASVLRSGGVHVVPYRRAEEKFWLSLRLKLPAKRYQSTVMDHQSHRNNDICLGMGLGSTQNTAANTTRLNSNSHESLEILV